MKALSIGFVLLAVVGQWCRADVSAELHASQATLFVEDSSFGSAVQLLSRIDLAVRAASESRPARQPSPRFAILGGVGVGVVLPSAPDAIGTVVRGLTLRSLTLGAELQTSRTLSFGASVHGVLAAYRFTSIIFFYPEVELHASVDVPTPTGLVLRWQPYLSYPFRPDVRHAATMGLRSVIGFEIVRGDR